MVKFSTMKYCPGCQKTKDLNDFHKNKNKPDARHDNCKVCRHERYAAVRKHRVEKGIPHPKTSSESRRQSKLRRAVERIKQSAVQEVVNSTSKTGGYVPHTEDLLERVIALMGGTDVLAEKLTQHIESCAPGSQQQGKALEMMMRYLDKHTQRQLEQSTPIEQATLEDLERRLDEALGRNAIKLSQRTMKTRDNGEREEQIA